MFRVSLATIGTVLLLGCNGGREPLFTLLSPRQTGITFENTITTMHHMIIDR